MQRFVMILFEKIHNFFQATFAHSQEFNGLCLCLLLFFFLQEDFGTIGSSRMRRSIVVVVIVVVFPAIERIANQLGMHGGIQVNFEFPTIRRYEFDHEL